MINQFLKHKVIKKALILIIPIICFVFTYSFYSPSNNDFEISKNLEIFGSVYKEINNLYVDEPQPGDLMKKGIDAMLESLDPYTNYIPESDIEDYRFMTTGQYGGIGSLIRAEGKYVVITDPYEGFPAQKAGLMAGDKIIEVDGKSIEGRTSEEVSKILKGQPGTAVKLKIIREGENKPIEKTVIREEVKIKDVPYHGMIDEKTGYIKLTGFTQTASAEVKKAFRELKEKHQMKNLIFDLRGNGGGLLHESVNIVNMFVPRGTEVVKQKGRSPGMNITYKANDEPLDTEIPLIILVDGNSASASEIVSGALQDLDRAVIIGERTYGKGLVQQTRQLPYNGMVKITVAKYYTPSGRCIQKIDYSTKNKEGKSDEFADSLVHKFKTKNGREVTDARGVEPDVVIKSKEFAKITAALYSQNLIFNYATKFRRENPTIKSANEYTFTESQYNDFLAYLNDKEYNYTTTSEQKIEELKKTAEKEKYLETAQKEFDALIAKLKPNKTEDLQRFKNEIMLLLENEIVSRYYYQTGRIQNALRRDEEIIKALELFNDPAQYKAILKGTAKK